MPLCKQLSTAANPTLIARFRRLVRQEVIGTPVRMITRPNLALNRLWLLGKLAKLKRRQAYRPFIMGSTKLKPLCGLLQSCSSNDSFFRQILTLFFAENFAPRSQLN